MSKPNWHGWKIDYTFGALTLYIGRLPGRKAVALYLDDGAHITPLAYFRSPRQAEKALALIDQIARVGRFAQEEPK